MLAGRSKTPTGRSLVTRGGSWREEKREARAQLLQEGGAATVSPQGLVLNYGVARAKRVLKPNPPTSKEPTRCFVIGYQLKSKTVEGNSCRERMLANGIRRGGLRKGGPRKEIKGRKKTGRTSRVVMSNLKGGGSQRTCRDP